MPQDRLWIKYSDEGAAIMDGDTAVTYLSPPQKNYPQWKMQEQAEAELARRRSGRPRPNVVGIGFV